MSVTWIDELKKQDRSLTREKRREKDNLLTVEHHEELVKSQKFREALEHPGSTRFFGNMPTNVVSNATI